MLSPEHLDLVVRLSKPEKIDARRRMVGPAPPGHLAARFPILLAAAILASSQVACLDIQPDPVAQGKVLSADLGCAGCHTASREASVGPTWKGLWGSQVTLSDGRTIIADKDYIAGKLTNPSAAVVAGYPSDAMVVALRASSTVLNHPGNVEALTAYIQSLR